MEGDDGLSIVIQAPRFKAKKRSTIRPAGTSKKGFDDADQPLSNTNNLEPIGNPIVDLEDEDSSVAQVVRKPTSRRAIATGLGGNSGAKKSVKESSSSKALTIRRFEDDRAHRDDDDRLADNSQAADETYMRPKYSAEGISALKASTPVIPQELKGLSDFKQDDESGDPITAEGAKPQQIDVAAKFGSTLALQHHSSNGPSAIPSYTEIQEKKSRRARLAKEQDYISLDDDDENTGQRLARGLETGEASDISSADEAGTMARYIPRNAPSLKMESRVVQDEDEIGEGFDAYVTDGKIAFTSDAQRNMAQQSKTEIKNLIDEAEGALNGEKSTDVNVDDENDQAGNDLHDDVDSSASESEKERLAAYEAAQTAKGMDGLGSRSKFHKGGQIASFSRPQIPGKITPLPSLGGIIARLEEAQSMRDAERRSREEKMRAVEQELADIETRKSQVQTLMKETAQRFERLRDDMAQETGQNGLQLGITGGSASMTLTDVKAGESNFAGFAAPNASSTDDTAITTVVSPG